jgi:hypothetical protein
MGNPYKGIAGNPGTASQLSISSSTNTNPIQITTSAPHGLVTGDGVHVAQHATNTNADGQWTATVINNSIFSIPVAGNGVGGATGTVQPLTWGTTYNLMADGTDNLDASHLNIPGAALGDRTALLAQLQGKYKMVNSVVSASGSATSFNTLFTFSSVSSSAWTPATSPCSIILGQSPFAGLDIISNDLIEFTAVGTVASNTGTNLGLSVFASTLTPIGSAPAGFNQILGSAVYFGSTAQLPFSTYALIGPVANNGNTNGGLLSIQIEALDIGGSGTHGCLLSGQLTLAARVWRLNPFLQ